VETLNWEKSQEGGESTIIRRLHELHELFVSLNAMFNWKRRYKKVSLLVGGEGTLILCCVHGVEWYGHDLRKCMIFTC